VKFIRTLADDAIGVTLDALKQSGQEARTLVFLFSDNGGPEVNGSEMRVYLLCSVAVESGIGIAERKSQP
jgi:arylsulfatase A-like enzyme